MQKKIIYINNIFKLLYLLILFNSYIFSSNSICRISKNKIVNIYDKPSIYANKVAELPYHASYIDINTYIFANNYSIAIKNNNRGWIPVEYTVLPSQLKYTIARSYKKSSWMVLYKNNKYFLCDSPSDPEQKIEKQYRNKLYKVIRHNKNEYLNVRIGRGSNYSIIDRLPYNQTNIKIKTCSKSLKGGKWCWINYTNTGKKKYINNNVNYINREGWVSGKFLKEVSSNKIKRNETKNNKILINGFSNPFIQNIENGIMAVSNKGKLLAITNNKSIKLIDINTGKLLHTFIGHEDNIQSLTFTKDDNYIISASDINREHYAIRVWNVKNGKEIDKFGSFDEDMKYSVDFIKPVNNDKDIFIIVTGFSFLVNRINHKAKKLKCEFDYGDGSNLDTNSNYFYNIYTSSGSISKQNIFTCEHKSLALKTERPKSKDREFANVLLSKNSKYLIIIYKNNKINIYDLGKEQLVKSSNLNLKYPKAVAFKKNLLLIKDDITINFYNFINAKMKKFIKLNNFYIYSAKIDFRNNQIIAGVGQGESSIVSIWDIKNAKLKKNFIVFKDDNDFITDILITENSIIVSGFNRIKSYDIKNYSLLWSIDNSKNDDSVVKMVLTKNNKRFITASDHSIKIRSIKNAKTIKQYTVKKGIKSIALYKNKFIIYSDTLNVYKININSGKKVLLFEDQKCLNIEINNNNLLCSTLEKDLKILDLKRLRGKKVYTKNKVSIKAHLLSRNKYITFNTKSGNSLIDLWDSKKKEKLATFALITNNSWLTITPEGYFTGSKDAAKYLNITKYTPKGMEPFDFSQLYDHFFRPDLVKLKLSGNEEAYKKAIGKMTYQEALKNPPPKINFVSVDGKSVKNSGIDYDIVKTNKNRVKITFNIKEQKGGVGLIRIYQEGKLVKTIGQGKINRESANLDTTIEQDKLNQEAKAKQKVYLASFAKAIDKNISLNEAISKATQKYTIDNKAGEYTVEIELKAGKNEIGIEVFNKTNTVTSFRESLTVDANIPKHKPKLYAIVAGVNKFEAKWASELKYSVNDAKSIKELAEKNMNKVFDSVDVKYLTNQEVTKDNIYKAIKDIATKAKLEDTILFFISTHGKAYKGRLFLVPQNNNNIANLINFKELFSKIQSIKSLNQIFIIDACESGEANDIVSSVYDSRASVLAKSSGVHLLLATTRGTYAFESQDPKVKHSMFTNKILQALKSKKTDLNRDNFISILELSKTLKQNQKSNSYQYPVIRNVGRDVRVEKVK